MIAVTDQEAVVTFDRFDAEAYELFLRCKRLPESAIAYDWRTGAYTVTTAVRYVPLLDDSVPAARARRPLRAEHLFDYQAWIVRRALDARRFAVWIDTGLGKTLVQLEWARHVSAEGPVLMFAPLQVVDQTLEEASVWYGDRLDITRLSTRTELETWLAAPAGVAITNTEKLAAGQLPLRRLTGIVLDESSILKTGGGSIKWNLIHSAKGVPFKLSLTATPAPNDTMEYASQAAFLERLRHEGEILWTWFARDKRGNWRIKPHGLEAFYRFMASWSVYMRDPAAYGFAPILQDLPDPVMREHRLDTTPEQRAIADGMLVDSGRGLFDERLGVRERAKFAQLARGFLYTDDGATRIRSDKPAKVAELVTRHLAADRRTLVWTAFDEEARILAELLPDATMLHGDTPAGERSDLIRAFRHGDLPCLITKAQLVGQGMNFQACRAMVFSGLDDSFERRYQAIRRAYRFGQKHAVHVDDVVIPELEGLMLDNVKAKEQRFLADVAIQEAHYRRATEEIAR